MKASTLFLIAVGTAVAASSSSQTLPNRAKEMSIFDDHIGKWTGTMKWVAPGLEGDRMVTINNEWDGLFLKSTSSMDMPDHKVTQTSMTGWDPSKGEYQ